MVFLCKNAGVVVIYVRAGVTAGLLALAAGLFFVSNTPASFGEATTIVGLVVGYWLREGEAQVANGK